MDFPTIVYKDKGPHQRPGGTFDYKPVRDQEELDSAIADGWKLTMLEVMSGEAVAENKSTTQPDDVKVESDDVPASRKELFEKARELGLEVSRKMTNDEIEFAIESAIAKGN